MRILLQDVVLENPNKMRYIDAYNHWCKHGR